MALDLAELVAPAHTALVTSECQRGVIGDLAFRDWFSRVGDGKRAGRRASVRKA